MASVEQAIVAVLRDAIVKHSSRGLRNAACMLGELLMSYCDTDHSGGESNFLDEIRLEEPLEKEKSLLFDLNSDIMKESMWYGDDITDSNPFLIAKTFFDLGDYKRAAFTLSPTDNPPQSNRKELFLWVYSLYLFGEEKRVEATYETSEEPEKSIRNAPNEMVPFLLKALDQESFVNNRSEDDAFCYYIYGLILKSSRQTKKSRGFFVKSIQSFAMLWPAWEELVSTISSLDEFTEILHDLPSHWMTGFFKAKLARKLRLYEVALLNYRQLSIIFPNSNFIRSQTGSCFYHLREFHVAQDLFTVVLETEPFRLADLDIYSNILFVKEMIPELSRLAHNVQKFNKFRVESCCIIGNYYCAKKRRERAILYFRRALRLDPLCSSAWVLMGHEYMETNDSRKAIECYKEAISIEDTDHRPWYGIGQVYEVLSMYASAVSFYEKAAELRPKDARMWCSLANCHENNDEVVRAVECYQRADNCGDVESLAARKLGGIYAKLAQNFEELSRRQHVSTILDKVKETTITPRFVLKTLGLNVRPEEGKQLFEFVAAEYFSKAVASENTSDIASGGPFTSGLAYLANFWLDQENVLEAETMALKLAEINGFERRDAESLLTRIRARKP